MGATIYKGEEKMTTGDLVHMKLDGEVLESTLGVVTGSMGDDNYKILWLDDASSGEGSYNVAALQAMNDEDWQETLFESW